VVPPPVVVPEDDGGVNDPPDHGHLDVVDADPMFGPPGV
jgi:hypothetical protein